MDVRKTNTVSPKKRESNLSKDRKWRSFPKVPHLLQYVSSGQYYARVKVNGKTIRRSLKTKIWTTAKLRLVDFLKEQNESRGETPTPTFADAVNIYEGAIRSSARLKASSLEYRLLCLKRIKASWPELWKLPLDQVSIQQCRDWAALQSKEVAACYYNNLIATLRLVFAAGVDDHRRRGGRTIENPAQVLPRVRVKQKELKLPESAQFRALLQNLRLRSGGWGRRVADLIEFLAYSGMRIRSEALWVAWEDVDWQSKEIVVRGHPETGTKNSEVRRVPIITDMEGLLSRLSVSAVTETDPPWIEMTGFKLTHLERSRRLQVPRKVRRMCGLYGQHTQGARTGSNQAFNRAGLGDSQDRPGTARQS